MRLAAVRTKQLVGVGGRRSSGAEGWLRVAAAYQGRLAHQQTRLTLRGARCTTILGIAFNGEHGSKQSRLDCGACMLTFVIAE